MFSNNIKCESTDKYNICNELIDTLSMKGSFQYIISTFFVYFNYHVIKASFTNNNKQETKKLNKFNSIMLMNQSIVYFFVFSLLRITFFARYS